MEDNLEFFLKVEEIIKDTTLDDENQDNSKVELILALLQSDKGDKWKQLLKILIQIMEKKSEQIYWKICIDIIFTAISRKYSFDSVDQNYLIALLLVCSMESGNEIDENEIWSIIRVLKNVEYLSDYDPFKDEAVWSQIQKFKR